MFGCGCFRASRVVYESMAPPWFDLTCNSAKTQRIGGEGQFFAGRLRTKPKRVGVVGRLTNLVIIPKDEGQGYRIISPVNLRAEIRAHWTDEAAACASPRRENHA